MDNGNGVVADDTVTPILPMMKSMRNVDVDDHGLTLKLRMVRNRIEDYVELIILES